MQTSADISALLEEASTGSQRNATPPTASTTTQTNTPVPMEIDSPRPTPPHETQTSQTLQTEQLQASVEDTPETFVPTSEHQRMDEPLLEETSIPAPLPESGPRRDDGVDGSAREEQEQPGPLSVPESEPASDAPVQASSLSSLPSENVAGLSSTQLAPALSSTPPTTTTSIEPRVQTPMTESTTSDMVNADAQRSPPSNQDENEKDLPSLPIENRRQPYSSSSFSQPQSSSTAAAGRSASNGSNGGGFSSTSRAGQGQGQGQGAGVAGSGGAAARGMPMLSGRPPVVESDTCRACGKYFIPLIRKRHTCNHCGYSYCGDDCSGYALMPRHGTRGSGSATGGQGQGAGAVLGARNGEGGYEMVEVCTYCTPMLQVTSGHAPYLRSLPLKRLQAYTKAYGLDTRGAIEKEDFVRTIVDARSAVTGCLSPEAESYYRRRSVPKQGVLPNPPQTQTQTPRPQTRPQTSQGQAQGRPNTHGPGQTGQGFRPQAYRPASQPSASRANPGAGYRPPPPRTSTPQAARTPPSRSNVPTPASTPRRAPSPPVPSILSLVALPQSYLPSLSIGTLKAILYENHVKVDFSQVLEKQELVGRVAMLVADERRRLERQRAAEEAEEREANGGGRMSVDVPAAAAPTTEIAGLQVNENDGTRPATPSAATTIPEVPTGPKASVERDGLCVVCQDQEAVFANIDCGHLCMCADCSRLVMATTRECPMCRTRIVTEQRLIRIFKT